MRKRWFFVTLLVGVLALGITGGTVLAQENGVGGDSPLGKFTSRVANILGLDEAQVQDALDQAAREIRDESLQLKLDHMVESGRLTQEQADAYLEWYQSRPDGLFSAGLEGMVSSVVGCWVDMAGTAWGSGSRCPLSLLQRAPNRSPSETGSVIALKGGAWPHPSLYNIETSQGMPLR